MTELKADSTVPMSTQRWQYSPLSSTSSIRLIQLLPSTKYDDELECLLVEVDLKNSPEYIALSYTWGEKAASFHMLCEGAYFTVTPNLYAALRQIRSDSEVTTLWVDSVCLNQDDSMELHHQVNMMGDIYQAASHVYIWLGEITKDYDATDIVEVFQEIDQKVSPKFTEIGQWKQADGKLHEVLGIPAPDSQRFTTFVDFLVNRPWFDRAWTFQESYLAKKKTFKYGHISIPQESMELAISMFMRLLLATKDPAYRRFSENRILMMVFGKSWHLTTHFPTLVLGRRCAECERPSDLIYSLLGLADDTWKRLIVPDYTKPFSEVFQDFAANVIQLDNNLDILSLITPGQFRSLELPSWVPDLRAAPGLTAMNNEIYSASGASKPPLQSLLSERQLVLKGVTVDTVSSISPNCGKDAFRDWAKGQFASQDLTTQMYEFTHESVRNALIRTIWADETREFARFDITSGQQLLTIIDDGLRFTNRVGDSYYALTIAALWDNRTQRRNTLPSWFSVDRDGDGTITRNIEEAYIIHTQNRILGSVAQPIEVGDIVIVALGGKVPIVLRPTGAKYCFISECYLHGFMDGEAFVKARMAADESYDGKDISWLEDLHEGSIPFPLQEFVLM